MKTKITLLFLFNLLLFLNTKASVSATEYINEAAIVARVESFNNAGSLNCAFECFLDMKYSNFENAPVVVFQVGTSKNPTLFEEITLQGENLKKIKIETVLHENSYKLKINFGKIRVKGDFIARLVIKQNGVDNIIHLKKANYRDEIAKMKDNDEDLCKAELFLRKINFDRLYDEGYFEEYILSAK